MNSERGPPENGPHPKSRIVNPRPGGEHGGGEGREDPLRGARVRAPGGGGGGGDGLCAEHSELFEARAAEEAWGPAWNILPPWLESARYIGGDELTQVMEGALAEVEERGLARSAVHNQLKRQILSTALHIKGIYRHTLRGIYIPATSADCAIMTLS